MKYLHMLPLVVATLGLSTQVSAVSCGSISQVEGSYIAHALVDVADADTGEVSKRSALLKLNADGTMVSYLSSILEQVGLVGMETAPSVGSWKCDGGTVYAVAFDYYSLGTKLGGKNLNQSEFNEIDRITFKITSHTNGLTMERRLIGLVKTLEQGKLDPEPGNANITVVSDPSTFDMRKIVNIKAIVDADFAR